MPIYAIYNPYNNFFFSAYSTQLEKIRDIYEEELKNNSDNNKEFIFIISIPEDIKLDYTSIDIRWARRYKIYL